MSPQIARVIQSQLSAGRLFRAACSALLISRTAALGLDLPPAMSRTSDCVCGAPVGLMVAAWRPCPACQNGNDRADGKHPVHCLDCTEAHVERSELGRVAHGPVPYVRLETYETCGGAEEPLAR